MGGATTAFFTLSKSVGGTESCFYLNRGFYMVVINASLALVVVLHTAINILPVHAVLAQLGTHLKESKLLRVLSGRRFSSTHVLPSHGNHAGGDHGNGDHGNSDHGSGEHGGHDGHTNEEVGPSAQALSRWDAKE